MNGVTVTRSWSTEARGFVFSTFAASYRKSSGLESALSFKANVMEPCERAAKSGRACLELLHLDGSPDDYVGWALTVGDALVYCYVKQAYRRRGFGASLLPDGLSRVVFQTPVGAALQRKRFGKALRPAPYLLMEHAA